MKFNFFEKPKQIEESIEDNKAKELEVMASYDELAKWFADFPEPAWPRGRSDRLDPKIAAYHEMKKDFESITGEVERIKKLGDPVDPYDVSFVEKQIIAFRKKYPSDGK